MSERSTTGPIPTASFSAPTIAWCYCVRLDMPAPIGTKRFTDGGPAGDVVANIDTTGTQTWSLAILAVGALDQGDQGVMAVSMVRFANLDGQWSTWERTERLRNTPVQVWMVWFDPDTNVKTGQFKIYDGRIDNRQFSQVAELVLKPHHTPWTRETPWLTPTQLGAANLMPDPGTPSYFGDQLRSNDARSPIPFPPPFAPIVPREG